VTDSARIQDLKARVARDPASIAFAQLAEEYRRAGQHDDAVHVSRRGLALHPEYTSARVTLGRALLALGRYDEAQTELETVQRAAPDNLSAVRALAELQQRRGVPGPPPAPAPLDIPAPPLADLQNLEGPHHLSADDPVLADLEAWLDAIVADRERRHGSPAA
jgi:tetratricopeptide (TPR) repeat protein